jgi:hypothetical protein
MLEEELTQKFEDYFLSPGVAVPRDFGKAPIGPSL